MKQSYERLFSLIIKLGAVFSSTIILLVFISILRESMPFFNQVGFKALFESSGWRPINQAPTYGLLAIILGTLYVSFVAIVLAFPIGIGCALYLCFCVPKSLAKVIGSFIDILSGIPSVIFGFIGLTVLVKFMESHLKMASGESVLAGGILLSVMLLPYVITGCLETFQYAKEQYYTASLTLGVSKWHAIRLVILPYSASSLLANMLLALGRAMGETMAVMMVIGNSPIYPKLMGRTQTIPSLIALEMGTAAYKSTHYYALYTAAFILLLILIIIQLLASLLKQISTRRWHDEP
ncbi:MAG: phosphate ABC transporter permease subunit PstC [Cellulosilyticaceae bacterium]